MVTSEAGARRASGPSPAWLGVAFIMGCATSTPAPATSVTPPPTPKAAHLESGWMEAAVIERLAPPLQEAFLRERAPLPIRTVVFADDDVRLSGEASRPPTVEDIGDEIYEVDFPLEVEGEQMSCFVYDDSLDLGTVVLTTFKEVTAEVEKALVVGVRSGAEEGRPFVLADVLYRVVHDGEPKVGIARIAAGSAWASTLMCILDMPGMRDSFERMFRRALGSLQSTNAQLPPNLRYHDVYLLDGGDWVAGYVENVVVDVGVGEAVFGQYSGRLYRSFEEGELGAFDSSASEESIAGRVHTINTAAFSDGELQYSLVVTSKPETPFSYQVEGEAFGQEVSSSFDVERGLEDLALHDARVASLMQDQAARSDTFHSFSPGRDPRGAIQGKLTKLLPPRAGYNVAYTFPDDNREYLVQVNPQGRTVLAEYELTEGLPMRLELAYSDGELR